MDIGRLLGAGKEAEVYEAGPDVLKLYRLGVGPAQARHEADILEALRPLALRMPRALGVIEADGRWGLLMSRMVGEPLAARLMEKDDLAHVAVTLAELHAEVNGHSVSGLPTLKPRLADRLGRARQMKATEQKRLLDRLAALPDGDRLCHGDFHPFNIMMDGDEPAIIDWLDATSGPPEADVCRTYLLALHHMPELAETYLTARLRGAGFDRAAVMAWMPVLAGARLAEHVPEEEQRLLVLARS